MLEGHRDLHFSGPQFTTSTTLATYGIVSKHRQQLTRQSQYIHHLCLRCIHLHPLPRLSLPRLPIFPSPLHALLTPYHVTITCFLAGDHLRHQPPYRTPRNNRVQIVERSSTSSIVFASTAWDYESALSWHQSLAILEAYVLIGKVQGPHRGGQASLLTTRGVDFGSIASAYSRL